MKDYCDLEEKIKCICNCEYKYFFNKANVIGVGMGYKVINGFCTCQKCITIFVTNKIESNKINSKDLIPYCYKGILTDVMEINMPKVCSLTKRIRPTLGGYSIGVDDLKAGTIGCLVADNKNDYILTCNHVVAGNVRGTVDKFVVQPAPKYGGKVPKDVVGLVSRFVPVDLGGDFNYVDAAIVKTDRSKASIAIAFIGPINRTSFTQIGEKVKKVGATTELTTGIIKTKYTSILINFLGRQVTFKNQITTTKMSDEGDSGSILLNDKNEALGMLMGDNSTISIYNTISDVVESLEVHILRN
ncbi:hypothetical protein Z957_08355 [Clostridium sp. K25]|uniref:Serine protease n=1 Tax=Clostridium botulinum D str. 1873 TaxID=592027 RepID=A0A9P2G7L4_CLOBO|nr:MULTISPECIES: serine protease [Clostridium]AYF53604.1 serine protease [Clostridium novyi]EES91516.1 conserved hypothetical protein [Clostridium botulinum D str. 1873]KEI07724.1 hypothetical protein Z957_08355 [Clostridium sp. K25]MBO3441561.1 trypsin-like peptidase domain-containing protein [Clostridium haemolyticum]MCD3218166.1 trypsin-like peptidase domain-containing protein [Clostridium botulinum C]